MEVEKRNGKGSIVAIIILTILVITLGGYIGYNNFLSNDNSNTTEENYENEEENTEDEKNNEELNENVNSVKTRKCTGVYSGIAALTLNFQTGEFDKGTLTIELKADGTYDLKKENIGGTSGIYVIVDNALLLETTPDVCGPGMDCSGSYSQYLNISEDCSEISWGYGSYFFDPDFTLNRQN